MIAADPPPLSRTIEDHPICDRAKIRDGQVANRPVYVAVGINCAGERDVLGLCAGEHGDGEGAKYWLQILTEIKNRT
jgi:transposase-like protein